MSFAGASDFIKWSIYTHETAKTFILLNDIDNRFNLEVHFSKVYVSLGSAPRDSKLTLGLNI